MDQVVAARPSLWRPSMFALTWQVCVWAGLGLIALSLAHLDAAAVRAMVPALAMITAVVVLGELRPIVMTRLVGNPVSISLAFVFATLYLWGIYPATVLLALATLIGELLQRKQPWRVLFNLGQFSLSLGAAWLVMLAAGVHPTAVDRVPGLGGDDLPWLLAAWVAYHLVNLALVAGTSHSDGETWWESFSDEFCFYTVSVLAVLALSPLVALVAIAGDDSWMLLPLLLIPLLAVQRAASMWREREHQALHDPLTGLPNRLLLSDRIEQALARGGRLPGRVVVLFCDLDMFKVVNDGMGHAAGDALLVGVAERLSAIVRPGDTLARFGGDEFVVVCDDVPTDQAPLLADRVATALRAPFSLGGREVTVTASVGIAIAAHDADAETLLRDADAAMYRAKEGGRDRAVVFDEQMHHEAAARLDVEAGLRRAFERDELEVHYQPIVNLVTGDPVGLEALVRWNHPDRGLLKPGDFIPVAEETGLIVPMGQWVLHHALACIARWRAQVPGAADLWVAVNLSARQLRAGDLVGVVSDSLVACQVPSEALQLEVTESVVMDEIPPMLDILVELRAIGVRLAIDDFGTGYSSLSRLKQMPVTTLKIDRSFVDGLGGDDPSDRPIADTIVSMARALELDVVAEGVETEAQRRTLEVLGATYAQGYLWARPIPEHGVADWLAEHAALQSS